MTATYPLQAPPVPVNGAQALAARKARLLELWMKRKAESTQDTYRRSLEDFRKFLRVDTLDAAAQMFIGGGPGHAWTVITDYQEHLRQRKLAPSTINSRVAAVRSLLKIARNMGAITWTIDIENEKVDKGSKSRAGPGRPGFRKMLRVLDKMRDAPLVRRDRAIMRLMFDRGLRRGEVASLDLEHLNRSAEKEHLSVLGKGRRTREWLTLAPQTLEALGLWLEVRGDHAGPLFHSLDNRTRGHRITGSSLARVVGKIGELAGLGLVRAHGLRHSATTGLLDDGHPPRVVQKWGRWSSLAIISVYDDSREDLGGEASKALAATV